MLENVIATVYHRHYRGGLFKWIQDNEDAFTEIFYLEKRYGMMMEVNNVVLFRIHRILAWWIQYLKNKLKISFLIENCNFLRSHAVHHD
jgi:hypothetical protein